MSGITDDQSKTPSPAPGNSFLTDMRFSLERWLRKTLRNPFVTFTSLVQPVIFFVLMAEVFGAIAGDALARSVGSDLPYVTYLVPAIIIQSGLAGAAVSGIGLVKDMETGMFAKTLVSPMGHGAMFLGKVLSEVVRIAVQTTIILLVGALMLAVSSDASLAGYLDTGLVGAIGIIGIVILFGGVFMAFSNVVALVTRDEEATILIANLLTFPLLFVSSAFVPLELLPGWIKTAAILNPITYGVDAVRSLLIGRDVMTVIDVTVFSGLWNTVAPAVTVLLMFNLVLGALAVRLLNCASRSAVQ